MGMAPPPWKREGPSRVPSVSCRQMQPIEQMNTLGRVLVAAIAAGLFAGCSSLPRGEDESQAPVANRAHQLDVRSARTQLTGKTMTEVLNAVGSPDRQNGNTEWERWTFEARFYDPITQRTLPVVTFIFRDDRLLDITY